MKTVLCKLLCRKCFYGGKVGNNLNSGCSVCLSGTSCSMEESGKWLFKKKCSIYLYKNKKILGNKL